ncbi:MAG TPA: family 20 glycosylhydrolase [Terriglobales bacterium]|nr:family 20 glycosylhydrolase [Terriglobales bacterium]
MKNPARLTLLSLLLAAALVATACGPAPSAVPPRPRPLWFGFHAMLESPEEAQGLISEIPALAGLGVNLIVAEIDYNYEFVSHPELRSDKALSKETVKRIVALCRRYRIRLVPEFQSLGHQSWAEKTYPLLAKYPQFDESPGKYPGNKGKEPMGNDFYCRSWCPLHPDLAPVIFALYDEVIDAFEADALHVGMDEVFLIGSEFCPRCRGKDPAELFAKAVQDAYNHIVGRRGKEMFMWGDRLLDGAAIGFGEWEASMNGTFPAVDRIPKDIIVCDWHYELNEANAYPSIPFLLEKGFRVLPTSFKDPVQVKALIDYSLKFPKDRMLGHLCTIWGGMKKGKTRNYPPLIAAAKLLRAGSSKVGAAVQPEKGRMP